MPQDWRTFRAQLVALERSGALSSTSSSDDDDDSTTPPPPAVPFSHTSWAHTITTLERGCLLVARTRTNDVFNQSVVLLASHGQSLRSQPLRSQSLRSQSAFFPAEAEAAAAPRSLERAFGVHLLSQHHL